MKIPSSAAAARDRLPVAFRMSLSVDEAAAALGISSRMLRSLIARREITVVRIRRRVLISTEALTAFIKSREDQAL